MAAPSSAGFRLNVWLLAFNLQKCLDALGPCSTDWTIAWLYILYVSDIQMQALNTSVNWRLWITLSSGAVAKPSEPWQCRPNGRIRHQICGKGFALFQCQQMSTDLICWGGMGWRYHLSLHCLYWITWRNLKIEIWMKEAWKIRPCHSCHCL